MSGRVSLMVSSKAARMTQIAVASISTNSMVKRNVPIRLSVFSSTGCMARHRLSILSSRGRESLCTTISSVSCTWGSSPAKGPPRQLETPSAHLTECHGTG